MRPPGVTWAARAIELPVGRRVKGDVGDATVADVRLRAARRREDDVSR
jgi:hypothetical protein